MIRPNQRWNGLFLHLTAHKQVSGLSSTIYKLRRQRLKKRLKDASRNRFRVISFNEALFIQVCSRDQNSLFTVQTISTRVLKLYECFGCSKLSSASNQNLHRKLNFSLVPRLEPLPWLMPPRYVVERLVMTLGVRSGAMLLMLRHCLSRAFKVIVSFRRDIEFHSTTNVLKP